MTDQPNIEYLPTTEIQENAYNPNVVSDAVMAALVANVKRNGFTQPILVRPNTGEGRAYEVVDGEHRLRAARAAGIEFVPCVVTMIDDAEAKAQTLAMNQIRGEMDSSQVAALIRDIDAGGIDLDQLAIFTGFSEDELRDLDRLLDIDWSAETSRSSSGTNTTPQGDDERWIDLRVRVPYSISLLFRSELDRLKSIAATEHDHLALERMVVNSSGLAPEHM
jgi:ParB/RepB/Spo0J family partition protein